MPTFVTHALIGAALGVPFAREGTPRRLWITGACLAAAPDLDTIGLSLGIPYESPLGHRGLSHSLAFAAITALVVTAIWYRQGAGPLRPSLCWLYLWLAMASHGLLDMMTDGGGGVAILAPFDNTRYFFPWRPVAVAPIAIRGIFRLRMFRVFGTEIVYIWIPAALLVYATLRLKAAPVKRSSS